MAETTLTIDKSTITNDVKSHLSIIGKRQNNKQGSTMFAGITLSSAEEAVISDYIKGACGVFASAVSPVVKTYVSETSITLELTRASEGSETALGEIFASFVEAYTIGGILGMDYPNLEKKYEQDAQNYLQSATRLAYNKTSPENKGSAFNISANIEKNVIADDSDDGYWAT